MTRRQRWMSLAAHQQGSSSDRDGDNDGTAAAAAAAAAADDDDDKGHASSRRQQPDVAQAARTLHKGAELVEEEIQRPQQQRQQQTLSDDKGNRVWTVPNALSIGRMVATPGLAWLVVGGHYEAALGGFMLAGALDWLDGYIARNYDQQSVLGSYLDPLADKMLVGALSLSVGYVGLLSWPVTLFIVARDTGLIAGCFVHRYRTMPPGSAFFDPGTSAFEIRPTFLSKVNTAGQLLLVATCLTKGAWGVPADAMIIDGLSAAVVAATFGSGLQYLTGAGGIGNRND